MLLSVNFYESKDDTDCNYGMKNKAYNWSHPLRYLLTSLLVLSLLFSLNAIAFSFANKYFSVSTFGASMIVLSVSLLIVITLFGWEYKKDSIINYDLSRFADTRFFLLYVIFFGITSRLIWAQIADIRLIGDAYSYYIHAQQMLVSGYFGFPGGEPDVHWPPGYSFVLYLFFALFGINVESIIFVNILLFILTIVGVFYATKKIYGASAAKFSALIILVWPNYLFLSATGAKEAVICAILPWLVLLFISQLEKPVWYKPVLIGFLLGLSVLTQPSTILLYGVVVFIYALMRQQLFNMIKLSIMAFIAMSITIAPWTVRNYINFDRFIMVSVNGGDVFYRANNPNSLPGYNPPTADSPLSHLPSIEKDKLGYKLGFEWIKNNPMDFASLSIKKAVLYFGNDDTSLWQTIDNPSNSNKGLLYYVLLVLTNAYWLLILLLLSVVVWSKKNKKDDYLLLFSGIFLCFLFVDMLFEAGTRHHIPLYGLMAIAVGGLIPRRENKPL